MKKIFLLNSLLFLATSAASIPVPPPLTPDSQVPPAAQAQPSIPQQAPPANNDDDCSQCVDEEQKNEMPILNINRYNPKLLIVCDDLITADDVYTGLMAIMVRVDDTLRAHRCFPDQFGFHEKHTKVHSLFGNLTRSNVERMKSHPILGTYIDTMVSGSNLLIKRAEKCFYDHRLMMKLTRLSMKVIINKLSCTQLALDIAQNRHGWPSKFGTPKQDAGSELSGTEMGSTGSGSPAVRNPNDAGDTPYTRWSGSFGKGPDQWPWNGWNWRSVKDDGTVSEKTPNRVPDAADANVNYKPI